LLTFWGVYQYHDHDNESKVEKKKNFLKRKKKEMGIKLGYNWTLVTVAVGTSQCRQPVAFYAQETDTPCIKLFDLFFLLPRRNVSVHAYQPI
jgi:hypothetical protein